MTDLEERLLTAGDALADAALGVNGMKGLWAFIEAAHAWRALAREIKEKRDDA